MSVVIEDDDDSVYEHLSHSERIVNGSVMLDWRSLPADIVKSLPQIPDSAKKALRDTSGPFQHNRPRQSQSLAPHGKKSRMGSGRRGRFIVKSLNSRVNMRSQSRTISGGASSPESSFLRMDTPNFETTADSAPPTNEAASTLQDTQDSTARVFSSQQDSIPSNHSVSFPNPKKSEEIGFAFHNCQFTYVHPDAKVPIPLPRGTPQPSSSGKQEESSRMASSGPELTDGNDHPLQVKLESQIPRQPVIDAPDFSQLLDTLKLMNEQTMTRLHPSHVEPVPVHEDEAARTIERLTASQNSRTRFDESLNVSIPPLKHGEDEGEHYPSHFTESFQSGSTNTIRHSQREISQTNAKENQAMKRNLLLVQQELSRLANELKMKSEVLKQRELTIDVKERGLKAREQRIEKLAEEKVSTALRQKDGKLKKETEETVKKYDNMIEEMHRAHKRTQASLKEMVNANRTLREGNKKLVLELELKDTRLEETTILLKQCQQRNTSLKASLKDTKEALVDVEGRLKREDGRNSPDNMIKQMKKIILARQSRPSMEVSTQTDSKDTTTTELEQQKNKIPLLEKELESRNSQVASLTKKLNDSVSQIMNLVYYLFLDRSPSPFLQSTASQSQPSDLLEKETMLYDTLITTFPILDQYSISSAAIIVKDSATRQQRQRSQVVLERYLSLVLDFVTRETTNLPQKHAVASQVYNSFVRLSGITAGARVLYACRSEKARLLTYFIILTSIPQEDVVEAVLERALAEVSGSETARTCFVELNGVALVHHFLAAGIKSDSVGNPASTLTKQRYQRIAFLTSALFLNLSSDGGWLPAFLKHISDASILSSITLGLQSSYIPTLENLIVVVQKLSKNGQYCPVLQRHSELFTILQDVDEKAQTQSLKGTLNGNQKVSDYILVNLRSILQNISVASPAEPRIAKNES